MTVSSETDRWTFDGNGVTTSFSYTNLILADTDLEIFLSGVLQILVTDYSVTGAGDPDGGNIVFVVAPPNGTNNVVAVRNTPAVQPIDYVEGDKFPADSHERGLDRGIIVNQQNQAALLRTLRLADSDPEFTIAAIPDKATRALARLGFDVNGDPVAVTDDVTGVAATVFGAALVTAADAAAGRVVLGAAADVAPSQAEAEAGTATINRVWTAERVFNAIGAISGRQGIIGGHVEWSVAANALTAAIKTTDGGDPSAAEPVYVVLRNATAATPTLQVRKITAALSVVASSGSTLGAISATPFKVWAVAVDNAGTVELALFQSVETATTDPTVKPLRDDQIISTTAEGGAGAADAAGILYSTTARANVAMRVLGHAEWGSGLTTAGTWDAAPTQEQLYMPGIPLPGTTLQSVVFRDGAVASGATTVPFDNTVPQNVEGVQFMSLAITPTKSTNILVIEHIGCYANDSAANNLQCALFQDGTADTLASMIQTVNLADHSHVIAFRHQMTAGTTSSTTFKIRCGGGAGNTTFNGQNEIAQGGGVVASSLTITEIAV